MNREKRFLVAAALMAVALLFASRPILADSLSASYYVLSETDPDTNNNSGGVGLLMSTLGPDGLPMVNAAGLAALHDVNANGELEWWSPSYVTVLNNPIYPSTITLPFIDDYMYTNTTDLGHNGDDYEGFLTAEFQGNFNLASPGTVTFSVCSDDDEFVYVDGTLVVDNGGIHPISCASPTNLSLGGGTHSLDVFYADRENVGATFQLTADIGLTPPPTNAPEPGTLSLLSLGLIGLAWKPKKHLLG